MRKSWLAAAILIAAAGALIAAGMPATASLRPAAPATASWHVAYSIDASNYPTITAVTASSPTSAWAFETGESQVTDVYELSGSSWSFQSVLGTASETVVSATSDASGDVWAFTSKAGAWQLRGLTWVKVKTFSKAIGSGLAIGTNGAWVFGDGGAWRYNGSSWKQYRSGKGLLGGSALSPSNIWAYGFKSVAHFNGSTWKSHSLASLMPRPNEFCRPRLSGIDALSSRNVYVTVTGACQDVGGPLSLLHFNGSDWKRLRIPANQGAPVAVVSDGHGGVWIPVMSGFPGDGSMDHYSAGHLHSATLPIGKKHLAFFAASTAPGSSTTFAVGYYRASFSPSTFTAEILRYGS
jgi:hypothetical protein